MSRDTVQSGRVDETPLPLGDDAGPGDSSALRLRQVKPLYPQLKARPGAARDAVRRNQRERLLAAMTEAVADHGYATTTVRELSGLAGVSMRTLYEQFDSKEDCLLSAYDHAVRDGMQRISAASKAAPEGERDWTVGLRRAFDAFDAELTECPKASRLALVDVLCVGSLALARIEDSEAIFMEMIAQTLAGAPKPLVLPADLLRGIVGGVWCVARLRVLEGGPAAISSGDRELLDWVLSCCSPSAAVLADLHVGHDLTNDGPRAPTGAPDDARLRAPYSAARAVGRDGYDALSVARIAEDANLSPEEFFALFTSAEECLLASLELFSAQCLARASRASEGAPNWPAAVCRATRALFCHIAADPLFARAAFVECFSIGLAGIQRQAQLTRSFAEVFARRVPRDCRPDPLTAEAIVGAVWSIARHQVARNRVSDLPASTACAAYLVLAPLIGAGPAVEAVRVELGESEAL